MISCCSSRDSTWAVVCRLAEVKCHAAKGWILSGQLTKIVRAPRKCMSVVGRLCTVLGLSPLGGARSTGLCPNPRFCLGVCLWIYGVWTTFAFQKLCLEVAGDLQRWSSPCALELPEAAMDVVVVPSPGAGSSTTGIATAPQTRPPRRLSWLPSRSRQHGEPRPPVPCPRVSPRHAFPPDCPRHPGGALQLSRAKPRSCPGARPRRPRGGGGRRGRPSAGAEL